MGNRKDQLNLLIHARDTFEQIEARIAKIANDLDDVHAMLDSGDAGKATLAELSAIILDADDLITGLNEEAAKMSGQIERRR